MWVDKRSEFADALAVSTTGTANVIFGEVIDFGEHIKSRAHSRDTIDVVNSTNTFTRSNGDFIEDGFAVGATVVFQGFTNSANNVETKITALTATVMTVTSATYTDESGGGNETVTSVGSAGGQALLDWGNGEPIFLVVQVTTALAGATSLRLRLYSDSAEALTTDPTTHWDSGVIGIASWTGTPYRIVLPISNTYKRYLGLWQNIDGTMTAGALNVFLTQQPEAYTPGVGAVN